MESRIKISDKLTSGKQPSEEEIRKLAGQGFKTVINLRTSGEEDQPLSPEEEGELLKKLGIEYLHIPVSSKEGPKPSQVDRFREEVERRSGPIFVHCRRGKRAGGFSMIHRAIKERMKGEEALEKAMSMGFECEVPALKEFFVDYINNHG
jgi:uncharacterized protein (TIGR01244 family)